MEVSNERLLSSSIKSGNKDKIRYAFEKIYNDYVKLVAFYIGKYISNQETIKDLTDKYSNIKKGTIPDILAISNHIL